jgi:hypothetical protein
MAIFGSSEVTDLEIARCRIPHRSRGAPDRFRKGWGGNHVPSHANTSLASIAPPCKHQGKIEQLGDGYLATLRMDATHLDSFKQKVLRSTDERWLTMVEMNHYAAKSCEAYVTGTQPRNVNK